MSMSMTYNDGETCRYELYLESHCHGKRLPSYATEALIVLV
jgi:hypothetical protein